MKIRFKNTVAMTQDQVAELLTILDREYSIEPRQTHRARVYTEQGRHGVYTFRVNLSVGIIKVLEVK